MSDLTDFLLARIAEDGEEAKRARFRGAPMLRAETEHRSKVLIVERCGRELIGPDESVSAYDAEAYTDALSSEVLEYLALPYADHPDYREEWKP